MEESISRILSAWNFKRLQTEVTTDDPVGGGVYVIAEETGPNLDTFVPRWAHFADNLVEGARSALTDQAWSKDGGVVFALIALVPENQRAAVVRAIREAGNLDRPRIRLPR